MSKKEKTIKFGKITLEDIFLESNYYTDFKEKYLIKISTERKQVHIAAFIDVDGEDWIIIKELYTNRYRRIKKNNITAMEVMKA